MGKYIGIDLGTTYSVVAYIDAEGKPQIVNNMEGESTTPSAVLFDGESTIVGSDAKSSSIINPDAFVAFAKRNMGRRNHKYSIGKADYSPEEISALILKKLCNDAEAALGDKILGAVITVPAYFTDAQRQATKDAAKMINLPVLAIINEPTAAALSYGISKGSAEKKNVLVYDLGGGTFDVSIMCFTQDNIEILSSVGNSQLGGYDFDLKIIDWFKDEAKKQGKDVASDTLAMQNLLLEAEKAKKALSSGRTKVAIALNVGGSVVKAELTKEAFEQMIDPLVYESISLLGGAMEEANLDYSDLDKVLLVGGSTRIPYVRQMIKEETGIEPSTDIHPDEAVAIGAAYHAVDCVKNGIESTNQADKRTDTTMSSLQIKPVLDLDAIPEMKNSYSFTDRTTHGIGIEIYDEASDEMLNSVILPKNSIVPAKGSSDFVTIDDYQEVLLLTVRQGETSELKYTTVIGETELKLRPKPKGSPLRVVVSCDTDSIIHIHVIDLVDGDDLGEMKIDRVANLTRSEMEESQAKIGKLKIGWE